MKTLGNVVDSQSANLFTAGYLGLLQRRSELRGAKHLPTRHCVAGVARSGWRLPRALGNRAVASLGAKVGTVSKRVHFDTDDCARFHGFGGDALFCDHGCAGHLDTVRMEF